MFTTTQFAVMIGCDPTSVRDACNRGEIKGAIRTSGNVRGNASGKRKGRWMIPRTCAWRPRRVGWTTDGAHFPAHAPETTKRSVRCDREDGAELESFLAKHATPVQAEEAREWMRKNGKRLPQLRRDPAIDNADREHALVA